jgi:nicotinamide-nucleotide adenylyltransferase
VNRAEIGAALERARRAEAPRLEALGPTLAADPPTLGLVSGSFDPMTVAHAGLARALETDLTLLVYSPATLPKEAGPAGPKHPPLMSEEDRVASLLAWCGGRPGMAVALCSHGLYADQAEAAAVAFPRSAVVLGVGSDKVMQLFDPRWYEDRDAELHRLFSRAQVAYAVRAGDEDRLRACLEQNARWTDRLRRLDLPPQVAVVSSRAVRAAVARDEDVSASVPPEILPFVRSPAGPP